MESWSISSKQKVHRKPKKSTQSNQSVNQQNSDLDLYPVIIEDVGGDLDPRYKSYGQFTTGLFKSVEIHDISHQKRISQSKWIVYFKSKNSQSKLLAVTNLGGIKVSCNLPQRSAVGVIKPIPVGISIPQIEAACPEIKSAFRLKRRDGIESNAVKVIFKSNDLPNKIKIGNEFMNVDVFVDPVLRCSKCQKLGHKKALCKSQSSICPRCGQTAHDANNSENNIKLCIASVPERFCINCKTKGHSSAWKGCPSQKMEKKVNTEAARTGVPRGVVKSEIKSTAQLSNTGPGLHASQSAIGAGPSGKLSQSHSTPKNFSSKRFVDDKLSFRDALIGGSSKEVDTSNAPLSSNDLLKTMNQMLLSFEKKIDDKIDKIESKLLSFQEKRLDQINQMHEMTQKSKEHNPIKHLIVDIVKNIVLASEGKPGPLVVNMNKLLSQPNMPEMSKPFTWDSDLDNLVQSLFPSLSNS